MSLTRMRTIILAALLAAAASSTGYAAPEPSARGIVESVSEVQLAAGPPGFPGPFEHALKPPTGDELLVRLDDGRAITVVQSAMQIFAPGQRVLVIPERESVRIEHAGEPLFLNP